jgi:hypothetical protein
MRISHLQRNRAHRRDGDARLLEKFPASLFHGSSLEDRLANAEDYLRNAGAGQDP